MQAGIIAPAAMARATAAVRSAAGVSATGVLYVGIAGLNQLTLANVLRTLNPPSSTGLMDYWELDLDGTNVMNLTTYWVDAANAGSEGVVVSYARR